VAAAAVARPALTLQDTRRALTPVPRPVDKGV
jgi:hypothetical protein